MGINKTRQSSIVGGVVLLTVSGLLVKLIGAFYKVPLSHLLGDEGMGYFNVSYTIYAWLYMLSTAGIPVALSILISSARAKGEDDVVCRVFRISARALFIIGVISTSVMIFGARPIARLLGSEDAYYAIMAIGPTLFFISLSSLFRGLFQGYGNMLPTALSQLIEAAGKVICGILLSYYAIRRGYSTPIVAAYAVLGVGVGTGLCTAYLFIHYMCARAHMHMRVAKEDIKVRGDGLGRRILSIAVPVTISASIMSLTGLIDLGMMIRRLIAFGFSATEATALYGNYTTLVIPVFNLPGVIIAPIATGIIPALARARSSGNVTVCEEIIKGAYKTVGMIALPCAFGMAVFARPILMLLYPQDSAEQAYRLLAVLAPAIVFLCLLTLNNAVLQACGSPRTPIIIMFLGGFIKVLVGYIVIGKVGILGAPIGTLACYFTAMIAGGVLTAKKLGFLPPVVSGFIKPFFASFISIGCTALLYYRVLFFQERKVGIILCILFSVALYFVFSLMLGIVKKEEIKDMLRKQRKAE